MLRDERLQVAGPLGVIGAVVCAQLCAEALPHWPTSSVAWYLNLEVFRSFRYGIDFPAAEQWLGSDGLTQSSWIAAPLLGLLGLGHVLKSRLPLAIASHVSLTYSVLILYGSCDVAAGPSAAFAAASALWQPSNFVDLSILLASILSSTISHRIYWREIFSCRGTPRSTPYSLKFACTPSGTNSGSRPQHLPSFSISA
jgi:hypothetical protein